MRSIGSFAELLHLTYYNQLDDRARNWIGRIRESVSYLQTLVNDLLNYSRLESQVHAFKEVALQEVVDHAISLLDAAIKDSDAEIFYKDLPVVVGERTLLVQLIVNLLNNAIKYRAEKRPQIYISSHEDDFEWIISVQDNGIGIEYKYFQKIFEIFQRLHDHTVYQGTGIGLAISRRVVAIHEGRIWVESEQDQGSTFYFTIKKKELPPS